MRLLAISDISTTGTVKSKTYQEELEKNNIKTILPNDKEQNKVMKIVYDVKLNGINSKQNNELNKIINRYKIKTKHIILGVTEAALALKHPPKGVILYDPLKIVAKGVVKEAIKSRKT